VKRRLATADVVDHAANVLVDWVAYTLIMRRMVQDASDEERGRGALLYHCPEAMR